MVDAPRAARTGAPPGPVPRPVRLAPGTARPALSDASPGADGGGVGRHLGAALPFLRAVVDPGLPPRGPALLYLPGRFTGVMRLDGSEERLLTASFLDEGPSWAPNGRVIMFTRESSGASGGAALYSVDISGRNLKRVPTPAGASDPAWSPLLK